MTKRQCLEPEQIVIILCQADVLTTDGKTFVQAGKVSMALIGCAKIPGVGKVKIPRALPIMVCD